MRKSITQLSVIIPSILLPAAAFALSLGSAGPGGLGLTPNLAGLDNGPHLGVEVRGWLYPTGIKPPPSAPVIRGKIGTTEYAMLLTPDQLAKQETIPTGEDAAENLGSDAEFYRVMTQKMVRIVIESRQSKQLAAELRSADDPVALDGWVSGSASPLLTIRRIGSANTDDATTLEILGINPTATRPAPSQI